MDRTLEEFVQMIATAGCHCIEVPGRYGPNGPPACRQIVRTVNGRTRTYRLPSYLRDEDVLFDNTARAILSFLGLNPSDYGYG